MGINRPLRVIGLGAERHVEHEPGPTSAYERSARDATLLCGRQVRALGAEGQQRVAIVGLGGTGSIAAQQQVHLGIRDFVLVDPDVVEETASEVERRLDPYIVDGAEREPSVVSLNGTVVSLAVSMALGIVCGAPFGGRHLIYNGLNGSLRSVQGAPAMDCFICSKAGTLG